MTPPPDHPRRPGTTPPVLVGRAREEAVLRDHLAEALGGHGGLVLIGGEAGIGKTALAEMLCGEAAERGALVLVGRCYDLTETPPYGPWIELFGRYRPADAMPPLPVAFAQRGTVGEVASQAALIQQAHDFLAAVAERRPLVLLLDDMHWADPASLDLLRAVARSLADLPLLALSTYRADELTRRHPLYALLPTLVREASAARIDLERIEAADIHTLVTARYSLPDADIARLVTYLDGRSEGNPFFLGELLRTLESEHMLRQANEAWTLSDLMQTRVPALLRQVIDGRFARLGDDAQRLLAVAAVIGQEVPLGLWAAVADADEETLAATVERAMDAQAVEGLPNGRSVRFAHALIREALYEGIIPIRRGAWHRRVGEQLLAMPHSDPDMIAYHFRQAGDARAAHWLAVAGERAERAYAWLTAIERYEAALAGGTSDTNERGWLLYRLARMLRYSDPRQGLAYLDEAAGEAARHGDAALAAATLLNDGLLHCYAGDYRQGIPNLEAGVAALEVLPDADMVRVRQDAGMKGNVRGTLITNFAAIGRYAEAIAMGEHVVRGASDAAGGDVYQGLRSSYAALGRTDEAESAFRHACTLYRAAEHFTLLGATILDHIHLVTLAYRADDLAERARVAEAGDEANRQARSAFAQDTSHWARMSLLLLEGDWDEARRAALAWQATGGAGTMALRILGPLAAYRGDREIAWEWIRGGLPAGLATVPGEAPFSDTLCLQRVAIGLATEAGDLSMAREWLEAHDRWLAWNDVVLGRAEGELGWATYYRAAGAASDAYKHATHALAHATEPRLPLALIAAHRLLGELDVDAGRFDDAAKHLAASLVLADACAAPFERALTLLAMAELHAARNERSDALALLDEVRTICTPLGAKPTLIRADALATRLVSLRDAPPLYPAGLSGREVEVLRLIAAGRTNRDIADALFLSANTVRIHVTHILEKTNTDNRAAAAAFAQRHGLA